MERIGEAWFEDMKTCVAARVLGELSVLPEGGTKEKNKTFIKIFFLF
jgi:hypothetical protein